MSRAISVLARGIDMVAFPVPPDNMLMGRLLYGWISVSGSSVLIISVAFAKYPSLGVMVKLQKP